MPQPRITVLMPVYNGENYLGPAIESILNQTYRDFELLIIDDGSTDTSPEICRSYRDRDSRIRLESNGHNLGLIATLNRGLDLAGGDYVARMDCDDLSFPERFARQIDFMDRHPDIGLCGTWYERISDTGRRIMRPPTEDALIRFFLIFDTVLQHSTVFLRRRLLKQYNLRYDPDYKYAEDYEFWVRCSQYTKLANIPEVHLRYRCYPENISNRFRAAQIDTADRVRRRYLRFLGLSPTEEEYRIHTDLIQFRFVEDLGRIRSAGVWLMLLAAATQKALGIPESTIHDELGRYWYGACARRADIGLEIWRSFNDCSIGAGTHWRWKAKLLLRSILRHGV